MLWKVFGCSAQIQGVSKLWTFTLIYLFALWLGQARTLAVGSFPIRYCRYSFASTSAGFFPLFFNGAGAFMFPKGTVTEAGCKVGNFWTSTR